MMNIPEVLALDTNHNSENTSTILIRIQYAIIIHLYNVKCGYIALY